MGMSAGGFSWNIRKKIACEQSVFERMDVFWQNMGMREVCFLENGRFFGFSRKLGKSHPIEFFGP